MLSKPGGLNSKTSNLTHYSKYKWPISLIVYLARLRYILCLFSETEDHPGCELGNAYNIIRLPCLHLGSSAGASLLLEKITLHLSISWRHDLISKKKALVAIESLLPPGIVTGLMGVWCCLESLLAQRVKNLPAMQETWVWSLGQKNPMEEEMATHSSILAWRIPWTEEPDVLQFMELQRIGHNWATNSFTFTDESHDTKHLTFLPYKRRIGFLWEEVVEIGHLN